MNTFGDDTVSLIQAAKDAGYVVPPELAKIADGIGRIVSQLPNNSPAKRYGMSYIITLVAGGFVFPEVELATRLHVLQVINEEENNRFLGLSL